MRAIKPLTDEQLDDIRKRHAAWHETPLADAVGMLLLEVDRLRAFLFTNDDPEYMCPNCVTPWKCNGPHTLPKEEH